MMLNQDVMIRKMTEQDIDRIMVIEVESFSLPWSKQSYISELKNNFANYLVCDCEGQVAGYGGIWVVFEEAHITNIAIAADYRGTGMGKALMLELENVARTKKAQRILLEVRPTNNTARHMYKSLGYIDTGLRKAYYSDNGEDAILMTKFLI
jgi:ribosomal-protein-alanine N-acetyltransferase